MTMADSRIKVQSELLSSKTGRRISGLLVQTKTSSFKFDKTAKSVLKDLNMIDEEESDHMSD